MNQNTWHKDGALPHWHRLLNDVVSDRWIDSKRLFTYGSKFARFDAMGFLPWGFIKDHVYHFETPGIHRLAKPINSILITKNLFLDKDGFKVIKASRSLELSKGYMEPHHAVSAMLLNVRPSIKPGSLNAYNFGIYRVSR